MKYLCVKWNHSFPNEPVLLYSELDDARWEIRKVEIYSDGRLNFACNEKSTGSTGLSLEPIPPLFEIAADPQFEPKEITKNEFEEVWSKRK